MNDAFKQVVIGNRARNFQHGSFKKKEVITFMGKRYEGTIFYKNYSIIGVSLYEVDNENNKISPLFSTITGSLWMDLRKAHLLNKSGL
jgi:hypothetical protein